MIDSHKIAEYRVLLVRQRVSQSPLAKIELMEAIVPDLGELLAMADAFAKIRSHFPSRDHRRWPDDLTPEAMAALDAVVRMAMRQFEVLLQARADVDGDGNARQGE